MTPEAAFADGHARLVGERPFGLAVSGGGDSVALLVLAHEAGHRPPVATVDHGLRDASAEIAHVAALCAERELEHEVLRWEAPTREGGQATWREARYGLLAGWARTRGARRVLTGHTADDVAETMLMRLSRGAGILGLGGIPAVTPDKVVARPLLGVRRAALRDHLRARGVTWHEDPSNGDPAHERVRARAALAALGAQGFRPEGFARSAERLSEARMALVAETLELAQRTVIGLDGGLVLNVGSLAAASMAHVEHLVSAALRAVSGDMRRPYAAKVRAAWRSVDRGTNATLHGCRLIRSDEAAWIVREDGRPMRFRSNEVGRIIGLDLVFGDGAETHPSTRILTAPRPTPGADDEVPPAGT